MESVRDYFIELTKELRQEIKGLEVENIRLKQLLELITPQLNNNCFSTDFKIKIKKYLESLNTK